MFDEKTILARLQNGEDAQKIADEMAAMINSTIQTYNDQKAAEEAAKMQAEVQKKEDLQSILDMFADWFNAYYGIDAKGELNADAVLELIDSVQEYIKAMNDLSAVFGTKVVKKPAAETAAKAVKTQSADETLNAFLNKMGW